jgi:hypothetical protein
MDIGLCGKLKHLSAEFIFARASLVRQTDNGSDE